MSLLDYKNTPYDTSYIDYYRNYVGPRYQRKEQEKPVDPKSAVQELTTGGFSGRLAEGGSSDGAAGGATSSSVGGSKGGGFSSPSSAANTAANALLGMAVPGYGLASLATNAFLGMNPVDALAHQTDMGGKFMGFQTPMGAMQSKAAMNDLDQETRFQASAFAQSLAEQAFNDAYGGNFADSIAAGGPLGDAPMSGSWGDTSQGGGWGSGLSDGYGGGFSDGQADSVWKNGGQIKPSKTHPSRTPEKMQKIEPVYGLLSGPGTGTSDSIPAVNVKTGEKVAVSTDEYVIPANVVKAKGKKFFDDLLKEYGGK